MTSRRDLLASVAGAATLAFGRRSEAGLAPTPSQPAGPFYPLTVPAHPGNDLLRVAGRTERAKGIVAYVGGRIFDRAGRPVSGARVEIWQCDANGRYHNVDDGGDDRPLDQNFQGFGRTVTDAAGGYRFRTIRPVPYPGRTPHIHFIVSASGLPRFVTQMYVAGEPRNRRDGLLMSIGDAAARARLIVALRPAPQIEANALAGTFDIVLSRG
ncbi:MAG: protocatechuate 3,4-dioxygenase [Bradyrhizobium sp.]